MSKVRLMSQNQWNNTLNNSYWEERGLNCSSVVRMKGHTRIFKELMPDVVGGQEVNKDMQLDFRFYCLEEGLPYTLIWGNMTPIIYRADRLELLDTEYVLYPIKVDGFEGEFNDSRSKSANLAVFRCKDDGEIFIFLTTHLWWKNGTDPDYVWYQAGSDKVRTYQLKIAMELIAKYQKKYNNCPAFLVGDLNTAYNTEAIQYALGEGGYSHAHDIAVEYAEQLDGYNWCGPEKIGEWENKRFEAAIDHILVRDFPKNIVRRFDRYTPDYYLYLSDHAPVFVDVDFSAK